MQTARPCVHSFQLLTLALDGQAEKNPVAAICPILPKLRQHSNSGQPVTPHVGASTSGDATSGPERPAITGRPASGPCLNTTYQCALRGRGWQRGQLKDDRFMNESRRIGVPQRPQGRPKRP